MISVYYSNTISTIVICLYSLLMELFRKEGLYCDNNMLCFDTPGGNPKKWGIILITWPVKGLNGRASLQGEWAIKIIRHGYITNFQDIRRGGFGWLIISLAAFDIVSILDINPKCLKQKQTGLGESTTVWTLFIWKLGLINWSAKLLSDQNFKSKAILSSSFLCIVLKSVKNEHEGANTILCFLSVLKFKSESASWCQLKFLFREYPTESIGSLVMVTVLWCYIMCKDAFPDNHLSDATLWWAPIMTRWATSLLKF